MFNYFTAKPDAELLWFGDSLVTVRVSAQSGVQGMSVLEMTLPIGHSPPLHIHRNQDEIFHILEGTMRFHVNGGEMTAHAGQTVLAPRNVPHTFRIESPEGARVLVMTQGPDFENMVREASVPASAAELPPQAAPTPETIARLVETCRRNNIDVVGAPLAA